MKRSLKNLKAQSAVELAIFGSIIIFIVSMIFRSGLSAGGFMDSQMKATRYAMSKAFEASLSANPARNSGSALVIEDRLSGDFVSRFGSRDRAPMIAGSSGLFTNQLFYPKDKGDWNDMSVLSRYDVWINGQRFAFITENFREITLPTSQGALATCGASHPTDTRCWRDNCFTDDAGNPQGCVILHRKIENNLKEFDPAQGGFDINFDGTDPVPAALKQRIPDGGVPLRFMWQWREVIAKSGAADQGFLDELMSADVDGDFYEEIVLEVFEGPHGHAERVRVLDRQNGDLDFTVDGRRPGVKVGLQDDAQMFSRTRDGTFFRVEEGKLFNARTDQFIRNVNMNDHVDVIQRIFQLSNNTGRFCDSSGALITDFEGIPGNPNPVEACNNCFSADKIQLTCLDVDSLKLFVRSRIVNRSGRSWFTRTEAR